MDTTQALKLMKLAPAAVDVCEALVNAEDAFARGDITFTERAELRAKALEAARAVVTEATQESYHA